jgi:hypothetical protein
MAAPHPQLGLVIGGGLLLSAALGAGVYAARPLLSNGEDEARDVVERYVEAWAQTRCDEAADLIDGPRADVLAACQQDADRMLDRVRIESAEVVINGDKGSAELIVSFVAGGQEQTESVHEQMVRVDGTWKVAWRN